MQAKKPVVKKPVTKKTVVKKTVTVAKKGRPAAIKDDPITLTKAEVFGSIGATHEEMAHSLGVCVRTIERVMTDDEHPFSREYKRHWSDRKMSLRRSQLALAESGNATMQIWLGKQSLGQRDQIEQTVSDTVVNLVIKEKK